MFRDNYKEIRAAAQAAANLDGYDRGIDRDAFGFRSLMLPRRENRYGHELNDLIWTHVQLCARRDKAFVFHESADPTCPWARGLLLSLGEGFRLVRLVRKKVERA